MNNDDLSPWPVDFGSLRFEYTAEDHMREATIVTRDGTVLASLFSLPPNESAVDACDGRGTMIALPPGSWEITVYGRSHAIHVLTRTPAADETDGALTPEVRAWAMMTVVWTLSPTLRAYG